MVIVSRKTLAIVSSYNVHCGNASYTHVLKKEFSTHYDTDVLSVDFTLLRNDHPIARNAARDHIRSLCLAIRQYDYVNIQFETGLFGYSVKTACNNVMPLIRASRNLIFTIHRMYQPPRIHPLWKNCLKNGPRILKTLKQYRKYSGEFGPFVSMMRLIGEKAKTGCASIIVHTQREKDLLKLYYNLADVVDFPITFLTKQEIANHVNNRESIRADVFAKYGFAPQDKYIGIFGFISENKGHHVLVNALRFLPLHYKVAIFGGQHPLSIHEYNLGQAMQEPTLFQRNNNAYISSLIDLAQSIVLPDEEHSRAGFRKSRVNRVREHRVRFPGSVDDDDFIRAIVAMDYVVVPYMETGQGGSGNAALALELQAKTILSRTFAFMELERYYSGCFTMADIGNPLQIAQMIHDWQHDFVPAQRLALTKYNIENNILIHKEVFEHGPEQARRLKDKLLHAAGGALEFFREQDQECRSVP